MPDTFDGRRVDATAHDVRLLSEALRMWNATSGEHRDMAVLLGFTVHAGEQIAHVDALDSVDERGNPAMGLLSQIEQALDMGADRLGHAVILGIDPSVLVAAGTLTQAQVPEFLARQAAIRDRARSLGVVIELNITSNTEISNLSQSEHPAARLGDAGMRMTVNTDDESTIATDVRAELDRLAATRGVGRIGVAVAILEGYISRLGSRELGNRERLKQQFRSALVSGLEGAARDTFISDLAGRLRVPAGESPEQTLDRILNYVFGI
jgi:hypothetical protein